MAVKYIRLMSLYIQQQLILYDFIRAKMLYFFMIVSLINILFWMCVGPEYHLSKDFRFRTFNVNHFICGSPEKTYHLYLLSKKRTL